MYTVEYTYCGGRAPAQGQAEEQAAQAALDSVANMPGFVAAWDLAQRRLETRVDRFDDGELSALESLLSAAGEAATGRDWADVSFDIIEKK